MSLTILPINMIDAPNSWTPLEKSFWTITGDVAQDIWGLIQIDDTLGKRPYVPSSGAGLKALFRRGDKIGPQTQDLTLDLTGTLDSNLRSLVKFTITKDNSNKIISGTVVFTLTEGSKVTKWSQNWAIKKINTTAGF